MKKLLCAGAALLLVPSLALGQAISGSSHDFSSGGPAPYNEAGGECISCHVPHNGTTDAPLWNHATLATGYTMYSSATLDGTAQSAPALVSLACLGCHDGVTAVDDYGGNTPIPAGGGGDSLLVGINTPSAVMGQDLSNDHPISITYNTPDADFNDATAGIVGGLPLYGPTATKDQVECGSCHNPHDPSPAGVVPAGAFLRQSEATICTTCHIR